MRRQFGYFNPDDYYETLLEGMIDSDTRWVDIGCGRFLFPSNRDLAAKLSRRCRYLHGVDPDDTIQENNIVHGYSQCAFEDFETNERFDLATLRMVAEHVRDPEALIAKLHDILAPGGKVVIYTIYRWSPVPLITWMVPFRLHHLPKKLLWNTEEKDTFPVAYRMNTRRELASLFNALGFDEVAFHYLDDCRTFKRFRVTQFVELLLWKSLKTLGMHYPEVCLLGVYQKC
jgi:SAM-dependent methyltransferase